MRRYPVRYIYIRRSWRQALGFEFRGCSRNVATGAEFATSTHDSQLSTRNSWPATRLSINDWRLIVFLFQVRDHGHVRLLPRNYLTEELMIYWWAAWSIEVLSACRHLVFFATLFIIIELQSFSITRPLSVSFAITSATHSIPSSSQTGQINHFIPHIRILFRTILLLFISVSPATKLLFSLYLSLLFCLPFETPSENLLNRVDLICPNLHFSFKFQLTLQRRNSSYIGKSFYSSW